MDSTVGRQVGAPFWITLPDRERQSQQEVCNRRRGGVLAEDLGQDTKYSVGGLQPEVGLYVCDVNSLKTFPRESHSQRAPVHNYNFTNQGRVLPSVKALPSPWQEPKTEKGVK